MSLIEEARTVRDRIAARLRELEPLVREYNELTKLASEMGLETQAPKAPSPSPGGAASARKPSSPRRKPREPARATPAAASSGPDEVSQRVLDAVRSEPGKTVAEYAEILSVSPTTLYRPVRELTNGGQLVKRGRQLYLS